MQRLRNTLRFYTTTTSLQVTEACANRIAHLNKMQNNPNRKLRVMVNPGGCDGFVTEFSFTEKKEDDDQIIQRDEAQVVVDNVSLSLIEGATVDFEEKIEHSKFMLKNIPKATQTCGCKSSFAVKL